MGAVWQAAQSSRDSTLQAKLFGGLKEHSRERKIPLDILYSHFFSEEEPFFSFRNACFKVTYVFFCLLY
ncbi:Ovostatin 1 [Manis pentadactyla]|nr:Ovostatin 1 [Manis pentadactyla]